MGAEMAVILTDAVSMDETASIGYEAFAAFDRVWELTPGRLYECVTHGQRFRIILMQQIGGTAPTWTCHIDELRSANETKPESDGLWLRLTTVANDPLVSTKAPLALQAGLDWIHRHQASTAGRKNSLASRRGSGATLIARKQR